MLKHVDKSKEHVLTREDNAKGGRNVTKKKLLAAKIRGLKRRGLTDTRIRELYELMTNSDFNSLDILLQLKILEAQYQELGDNDKLHAVIKTRLDHHKSLHGESVKVEAHSTNLNVNVNVSDEYVKRFKEKYGEITGR